MNELDRIAAFHPGAMIIGALCLGAGLAAAIHLVQDARAQTPLLELGAKITSCHDGDTCNVDLTEQDVSIVVRFDLVHHDSIRLCGINAPELKGETLATAKFVRDRLLEWVRAAKVVTFRPYMKNGRVEREKYGRLLGWLIADGVNLNDRLVTEGLAVRYIECGP